MDDWQDVALNNRRIPHGHLGKRAKAGRGTEFQPQNAIGTYTLGLSGAKKRRSHEDGDGLLEIHGFDETEQGFVCSFRLGTVITGVMLLAGSRKVLRAVVEAAHRHNADDDTDARKNGQSGDEHEATASGPEDGDRRSSEYSNDSDSGTSSDQPDQPSKTAAEKEDERLNSRITTFKKNSFRSPKFWIRWKGDVRTQDGQCATEEDTGYLVFSKNNCTSFSGVISCQSQGWSNTAISGVKIKPKVGAMVRTWSNFEVET